MCQEFVFVYYYLFYVNVSFIVSLSTLTLNRFAQFSKLAIHKVSISVFKISHTPCFGLHQQM